MEHIPIILYTTVLTIYAIFIVKHDRQLTETYQSILRETLINISEYEEQIKILKKLNVDLREQDYENKIIINRLSADMTNLKKEIDCKNTVIEFTKDILFNN